MLATVDDLEPILFRSFIDQRGVLIPIEISSSVPFEVVRLFWIHNVPPGGTRGSHAHKACHQYMICAAGSLHVVAFDGRAERTIAMSVGQALHVPPAILTTEHFHTPETVLIVLSDKPYDVEDYLDDRTALTMHRHQILKGQRG